MQCCKDLNTTCPCPPTCSPQPSHSSCPPSPSPPSSKYFHEIGAEMIDNHLIIRVQKDKHKSKKLHGHWDPPCDCDMVEIRRPSSKGLAKIVNGKDNNQILFQIPALDRSEGKVDPSYKPQAIAYHMGTCKGGSRTNDQCRTFTVYPQLGGAGSQEVHSDHLTEGKQDIFLLRIKKKGDTAEQKKRNIELELRTPRPPTPPPPPPAPAPLPKVEPEKEPESSTKEKKDGEGKKRKKKK